MLALSRLLAAAGLGLAVALLAAPEPSHGATRPKAPEPVSPGGLGRAVELDDPCPTYSWSAAGGFDSFELLLLPSTEHETVDPTLEARARFRVAVSGLARSWSPSLELCAIAGRAYTWHVRGLLQGEATPWSRGYRFRTPEAPSNREITELLGTDSTQGVVAPAKPVALTPPTEPPAGTVPPPVMDVDGILQAGDLSALAPVASPGSNGTIVADTTSTSTAQGAIQANRLLFNLTGVAGDPQPSVSLRGLSLSSSLAGKDFDMIEAQSFGDATLITGVIKTQWLDVTSSIVTPRSNWTPSGLSGGGSGYTNIPIINNLVGADEVRIDTAGASCGNRPIIGARLWETDTNQVGIQLICGFAQ